MSSYLATVLPQAQRIRLPVTRDQLMLLMAALSELFTGIDVILAHSINGQISRNEWIPIIFGVSAGVLLLLAGVVAFRYRPLATIVANLVFIGSILVGLLGTYFHLQRAGLIGATVAQGREVNALIWAPPFLGPAFFVLIGVLGISAAWIEDPMESGRLRLLGTRTIQMPYSKTRAYFLIVGIFILITTISSVMDHSRLNFENRWVWLPMLAGVFGAVVAVTLGIIDQPTRADLTVYAAAMLMLLLVGAVGFLLHISANISTINVVLIERFIRGSPLLAPLLFCNVGALGLIVLLDPAEQRTAE
jgi:hypothetical protein